jgi:hypothetical protein
MDTDTACTIQSALCALERNVIDAYERGDETLDQVVVKRGKINIARTAVGKLARERKEKK